MKVPKHSKGNTSDISFIQVIEDNDSEDFETDNHETINPPGDINEDNAINNCNLQTAKDVLPELPSLANIDIEMEEAVTSIAVEPMEEETLGRNGTVLGKDIANADVVDPEEEKLFSQLLPDFTGRGVKNGCGQKKIVLDDDLTSATVGTPPRLEEVGAIMDELDRQGQLSPVDVLDLIDKWETEKAFESNKKRASFNLDISKEGVLGHYTVDTAC